MKVLVAYASVHGSTAQVAEFVARVLRTYNLDVTVSAAAAVQDVKDYDAFVIGSAVHAGMWLHDVSAFIQRFEDALKRKPTMMFLTCIRVLEEGGYAHAMAEYIHHPTLDQVGIKNVAIFAGKLEVGAINWDERWLLASRYDGTQMSRHVNHDYRNWQEIATWSNGIAQALGAVPTFEQP